MNQDRSDFDTLAAAIARSQIVVARPAGRLPAGFDDIDIALLDWIVAEGRPPPLLVGGSHWSFDHKDIGSRLK